MRLRPLLLPGLVAVVVAVVGLTLAPSRSPVPPVSKASPSAVLSGNAASLKIANYAYAPATLTVRVGTRIEVTNADMTAHTVTARSGGFDSGTVSPGKAASFTVTKPGVYAFYCQFHAFMSGTIRAVK